MNDATASAASGIALFVRGFCVSKRWAPPDSWSLLWVPRVRGPTAISLQLGLDDGAYTEIVKGPAMI